MPFPVVPNAINQDFTATGPNQQWGADISYILTREGWLYLAVVMRCPEPGLLRHSDHESQYYSVDYKAELHTAGVTVSMSGRGNCFDNAVVETFFKTLKSELIWRQTWPIRRQAEAAIFQYINGFYNARR